MGWKTEKQNNLWAQMNDEERIVADYEGTGLTIGPHLLSQHRDYLKNLGVRCAAELEHIRDKTWVRIVGVVIVRQRPGTASGFIFMSFKDETGIANAIFAPQFYETHRAEVTRSSILLVEGELQNMDGTISVKVQQVKQLQLSQMRATSHDFH